MDEVYWHRGRLVYYTPNHNLPVREAIYPSQVKQSMSIKLDSHGSVIQCFYLTSSRKSNSQTEPINASHRPVQKLCRPLRKQCHVAFSTRALKTHTHSIKAIFRSDQVKQRRSSACVGVLHLHKSTHKACSTCYAVTNRRVVLVLASPHKLVSVWSASSAMWNLPLQH